jgi:hypothetical protein
MEASENTCYDTQHPDTAVVAVGLELSPLGREMDQ